MARKTKGIIHSRKRGVKKRTSICISRRSTPNNKSKKANWKKYGPLRIDWTNWQEMRGSYVAPTLNNQRKGIIYQSYFVIF